MFQLFELIITYKMEKQSACSICNTEESCIDMILPYAQPLPATLDTQLKSKNHFFFHSATTKGSC